MSSLPDSSELPRGHMVASRYRVDRIIGAGGMGAVYAVFDEHLQRKAALKLLLQSHASNEQLVERFHREARIAASIGHPGIVEIYERGAHHGVLYLVMEQLEGENLEERIERAAPLPASFVARVGTDLCSAIGAAHKRQIVHRDIKPSNVFLSEEGDYRDVVKVLDFGLAKLHEGVRLTRSNQVFGTLSYMAPEQLVSATRATPASDNYAIACVLYEMLVGRPPFVGANHTALGIAILQEEPTPLAALRNDLPRDLCTLIERTLHKAPEGRPSNATVLGDELFAIAERLGEVAPPRKRRSAQPPLPESDVRLKATQLFGRAGAGFPSPPRKTGERTVELHTGGYRPVAAPPGGPTHVVVREAGKGQPNLHGPSASRPLATLHMGAVLHAGSHASPRANAGTPESARPPITHTADTMPDSYNVWNMAESERSSHHDDDEPPPAPPSLLTNPRALLALGAGTVVAGAFLLWLLL